MPTASPACGGTIYPDDADDGIFASDGSQLLLTLTGDSSGYTSTFDIALQMA